MKKPVFSCKLVTTPRWQKWSDDHSYLHHDGSDVDIVASGDAYDCDLSNGTSNVVDKTKIKNLSYFFPFLSENQFMNLFSLNTPRPSSNPVRSSPSDQYWHDDHFRFVMVRLNRMMMQHLSMLVHAYRNRKIGICTTCCFLLSLDLFCKIGVPRWKSTVKKSWNKP